jgi:hypothetical protein
MEKEGKTKLTEFIKSIPDDKIKFDYFTLFEHISTSNKLDKENIIRLFRDRKIYILTLGNSSIDFNIK